MEKQGKVSVIIPVYNGEKYLNETLETIRNSTFTNLEIVIVNDGSTDLSLEICQEHAKRDPRIVIECKKNGGIAAARNTGLNIATGDWIAFCDQDDYVDTHMYEKLYNRVVEDQSDLAICGMGKLIDNVLEPVEIFDDAVLERNDILEYAIYPILFDGYFMQINDSPKRKKMGNHIWKCLISKKVVDHEGLRFKKFIDFEDDRTFLLDVLSASSKVSLLKECLYYWRVNLLSETYRKKHIYNIEVKMMDYRKYEENLLKKIKMTKEMQDKYFNQENCNNYIKMIENEYGNRKKTFLEKRRWLKNNIYNEKFQVSIIERKQLKKNVIKKRIVLWLLERKCLTLAYLFDILYLNLKNTALRYKGVTIIESWLGKHAG